MHLTPSSADASSSSKGLAQNGFSEEDPTFFVRYTLKKKAMAGEGEAERGHRYAY